MLVAEERLPVIHRAMAVDGWMAANELIWLNEAAAGKVVIEVGAYKGRSTIALAERALKVYSLDNFNGSPEHPWYYLTHPREAFLLNCADLLEAGKVELIEGDFHDVLTKFPYSVQADMIFLDGDHKEASVRQDITDALPLLHRDGLLCGHDYGSRDHPGVKKVVDDVFWGQAQLACNTIWAWEKS